MVECWHSQDALVLKAVAIVLTEHIKPHLSQRYFHLARSGGMKAAMREVVANLPEHDFVFRTDVKDDKVLALVWGYLRWYVSDGGKFIDITQRISLGCPLSPLMGALFLKPLDDRMAQLLSPDSEGLG